MSTEPHRVERRKLSPATMTCGQCQEHTVAALADGKKQFESINDRLGAMESHIKSVADVLAENTRLTQTAAALAEKTATDTSDLVVLMNISRSAAGAISSGAHGASKVSKLLLPIIVLISFCAAWFHGEHITLKELFEAMK